MSSKQIINTLTIISLKNNFSSKSEDDRDSSFLSETSMSKPPTPIKNCDNSTQTTLSGDGIFKVPPPKSKEQVEEEANIALRTRSKLSLSSTPLEVIEEAFIPPDITTDMYDMDCDDDDWKDFLKKFTRPLDEVTKNAEDEDHDPEYNVLADEEIDKGIFSIYECVGTFFILTFM